jgi:hypothetical protein
MSEQKDDAKSAMVDAYFDEKTDAKTDFKTADTIDKTITDDGDFADLPDLAQVHQQLKDLTLVRNEHHHFGKAIKLHAVSLQPRRTEFLCRLVQWRSTRQFKFPSLGPNRGRTQETQRRHEG